MSNKRKFHRLKDALNMLNLILACNRILNLNMLIDVISFNLGFLKRNYLTFLTFTPD
jgi:hypothetical protein